MFSSWCTSSGHSIALARNLWDIFGFYLFPSSKYNHRPLSKAWLFVLRCVSASALLSILMLPWFISWQPHLTSLPAWPSLPIPVHCIYVLWCLPRTQVTSHHILAYRTSPNVSARHGCLHTHVSELHIQSFSQYPLPFVYRFQARWI